jgi:hypothetical protein
MRWAFRLGACALLVMCSWQPIGEPAGDENYDDPNDPGQSGQSVFVPEAGDAVGKSCVAPRDCPADFLCSYPVDGGCEAPGRCLPFTPAPGCDASFVCACGGSIIDLCAPAGYASKQVATDVDCGIAPISEAGADDASETGNGDDGGGV